jgi:ElaB/YqjD/DUF883 family membrane-anchored ribosome-binding protein
MASGDTPTAIPQSLESELESSRQSAARLLENLARKIAATRAGRYLEDHPVKAIAEGVEKAVRRRPVYVILAAVFAGYLVGNLLSSSRRGD